MATRTSHSSPCFLRVAEASAASSASKITSLSTPFSLETASTTIRISLFTLLTSRRQPRLANLCKCHCHALLVYRERDPRLVHRQQLPGVAPAPGARLLELHEHPRADEASEMRRGAQHTIESRRGHLQGVSRWNGVLDIEKRGDLTAHALAVLEPDARRRVDEDPQPRAPVARGVFELDQLIAQSPEERLDELDQPLPQSARQCHRLPQKLPQIKMGPKAHLSRPRTSAVKTKKPRGGLSVCSLGGTARSPQAPSRHTSHPSPRGRCPWGRAFYPKSKALGELLRRSPPPPFIMAGRGKGKRRDTHE